MEERKGRDEGRDPGQRRETEKGGGRRQGTVHGSSHQRVVLIESLRGVCSSLLIWLNIPGWLRRRRYRRAKIHTERERRRADLTYRTNSRARPVPRDYGASVPLVCLLGNDRSLSLSLSSSISFSEFLQSTCIHIGKAKSPIAVFRRGIERSGSGWGWGESI